MAVTLTLDAQVKVSGTYTSTNDVGGSVIMPVSVSTTVSFTSGTGANNADQLWQDQNAALGTSATDAIALSPAIASGAPFGIALTMVEMKGIYLRSATANTDNIELGGNTNAVPLFGAVADFMYLPEGGVFLWASPPDGGITVTNTTGEFLDVTNSSGSVTASYDIIVWGASA